MTIKVRLFATFRNGRAKEMMIDIEDQGTVLSILEKLNIPVEEVAILLINGRDGKLSQVLLSTDVVSLFPPVGGG